MSRKRLHTLIAMTVEFAHDRFSLSRILFTFKRTRDLAPRLPDEFAEIIAEEAPLCTRQAQSKRSRRVIVIMES
jgi:hypothetical protein